MFHVFPSESNPKFSVFLSILFIRDMGGVGLKGIGRVISIIYHCRLPPHCCVQISSNSGTDAKLLPSPANLVPAFTPIQHSQIQLQSAPTQPIKKPTGSYSNPETRNAPAPAQSYAALTSVERPVSEHGPAPAIPAAESIPKKDDRKAEVKKSQSMAPGQPRVDSVPGAKKKKAKNCNPKIPVAANLSLPNGCEWWGVMHKKFVVDIQVPTTTSIASFLSALTCWTSSYIFAQSTYI